VLLSFHDQRANRTKSSKLEADAVRVIAAALEVEERRRRGAR
jgi:hypothetical protein